MTKAADVTYSAWKDEEDPTEPLDRIDAHDDGKNIGYLTSHPNSDGAGTWLKGLKVDPAYRGRGVGRDLLLRALSRYGDDRIALRPKPYDDSPIDADGLRDWYSRFGFRVYDDDGRMERLPAKAAEAPREVLAQLANDDRRDVADKVASWWRHLPRITPQDTMVEPGRGT